MDRGARARSIGLAAALAALLLLTLTACAGGEGSRWQAEGAEPAGFFPGLWHGVLLVVTLVVSFFTDEVGLYEVNNTGVAYNIGFVLGVLIVYGSGCRITMSRKRPRRDEWDEVARRVEHKVRAKVSGWVDEADDWKEMGEKIERKIKERLRRWLDEEKPERPETPDRPA